MMDDLISRQAAIDILDAYQVMVENGEENPYAQARLRMSELPSAQPDQRWIPCSERLPDESNFYLVTNEYDDVEIIWFAHKDDYNMDRSEWRKTEDKIIAWKEAPEPYQEGEQDG